MPGGDQDEVDKQSTLSSTDDQIVTLSALARASDLDATVHERHSGISDAGMHRFALPLPIVPLTVSLLWHPRLDGDPAHHWLRELR